MRSKLQTLIVDRIAASRGPLNRLKARRWGWDAVMNRPLELELYYEAGDPHSHLCAQWLRQHRDRLKHNVKILMVPQTNAAAYPEADKQRAMALLDAQRSAPAYDLAFPADAVLPDAKSREYCSAMLQEVSHDLGTWLNSESKLVPALFLGQAKHGNPPSAAVSAAMASNAQRRAALGHYLPGMWQFNGDWFWALDRMTYLEEALRGRGLIKGEEPLLTANANRYALPESPDKTANLEFFFSFRSPYSYLAATRLRAKYTSLALPLSVRPVLPMAMRGMKIPRAKGLYIVRDVYREARRLKIPFGHIVDPIGAGAERCLKLFPLAQGPEQQLQYCQNAAQAIWAEAIDVATDAGLRMVCERSGIDWDAACLQLQKTDALDYAEKNRAALFAAGCWGVPSFRVGTFVCWGNDRMPMLHEYLRRHFLA
jgi:2-hydroxychromene-2-carboxylate isomerase